MQKLFALTPLRDNFACNFNILVGGTPQVMGVRQILEEWCAWRCECVRRRVAHDLARQRSRLHLLKGLGRILLDIDRAIAIIRETEEEAEVVPNLMIGFGIDEAQAEFIAEIKLRNINKQYILRRLEETDSLEKEVARLERILGSRKLVMNIISAELKECAKKYGTPRRTGIIEPSDAPVYREEREKPEDYPVSIFLSREGYFKKITPQSLRMASEQRFKENDELAQTFESSNAAEVIFFTNKQQAYKCRLSDFEDTKASALGDFLPAKLGMDEGESVVHMFLPGDYTGHVYFFFKNGKCAKVEMAAYNTKSNRRRLTGAYSAASPLAAIIAINTDDEYAVYSTDGRVLFFSTASLAPKSTRATQGVALMSLKKNATVDRVIPASASGILKPARFRTRTLPAAGALLRPEDIGEVQLTLE